MNHINNVLNADLLLRTHFFTALLVVTPQPFEQETANIQSEEEQRLFVSLLARS